MVLWIQWWRMVRQLRPAFVRETTFLGFALCLVAVLWLMAPHDPRWHLPLRAGYRPRDEKHTSRITREFARGPNPREFHQTKD